MLFVIFLCVFQVKCSHKSITSTREIVFRCQFHTDAVNDYFLRLEKSQLDVAYKGGLMMSIVSKMMKMVSYCC